MPQSLLRFAVDDVVKDITGKIEGGAWANGERLPPERALAEQYGLARNTVRRALKQLEDQGRLQRQTGRGTFVQAAPTPAAGDLARRMQDASPEDVMEVLEFTERVEGRFRAPMTMIPSGIDTERFDPRRVGGWPQHALPPD